jgi:redox-sensing transcriptional repressor
MTKNISIKTIERLSIYRRILQNEMDLGKKFLFSHELASLAHRKPALIRRDLMCLKQIANTQKGYNIAEMINDIGAVLDSQKTQNMAIVGAGNMGRALLNFFQGRGFKLSIQSAFDIDKEKTDRVIAGVRCYHIGNMPEIIKQKNITIGIITVPEQEAQRAADCLVNAGIKAIVNIAPIPVKTPPDVFVEYVDITTSFEKTAYFAKIFQEK